MEVGDVYIVYWSWPGWIVVLGLCSGCGPAYAAGVAKPPWPVAGPGGALLRLLVRLGLASYQRGCWHGENFPGDQ